MKDKGDTMLVHEGPGGEGHLNKVGLVQLLVLEADWLFKEGEKGCGEPHKLMYETILSIGNLIDLSNYQIENINNYLNFLGRF